jgi:hypothetical protein
VRLWYVGLIPLTPIVPGQMPLAEVCWALGVRRVDEVPVLDALGALVLLGQTLARLRAVSSLNVSRRGFRWSKAAPAIVEAMTRSGG